MGQFKLHTKLETATITVGPIGLNRLLLMNDRRYPWLILVPQRADITEMHKLSPLDQTMMTFEMTQVAQALQETTHCDKINIAALGNQVSQLHVHVIARNKDDAAWPNPVWGIGDAEPYAAGEAEALIAALGEHL